MPSKKHSLEFEKPLLDLEKQLDELLQSSKDSDLDFSQEIKAIEKKIDITKREVYSDLTSWQKVQLSRHPNRPFSLDYIDRIFTDFQTLHGDRLYKEDASIVGGPAILNGQRVMVLGQQKGRNTEENLKRNFGCPNPEGYRKALRLMRMANRFSMPIISFIDTPGAFPGIEAEERHVAEAIAVNLREMTTLDVPILAIVIGEGGSIPIVRASKKCFANFSDKLMVIIPCLLEKGVGDNPDLKDCVVLSIFRKAQRGVCLDR